MAHNELVRIYRCRADNEAMRLSVDQKRLLQALAQGSRLKDHRDLDGHKAYVLYQPDDTGTSIMAADVAVLVDAGLISSNKKFPAATYWLTEAGEQVVASLAGR